MKKLMTMISAVAVAFGLQAAAPYPSGSHFNGENWLESDDAKMWTSLEGLSISTEPATFLDPVGYPAQFADEELANNLAFKRGLTDPTYRAIALKDGAPDKQTIGAGGVVVDTLIKFTSYDGDDQANIDGTNAKVAVWVKEIEGADGAASTYQLMVTAGQYVNENLVRKDYACSSKITDMDAWYRLTVKAISDVTQGGQIPGFVVLINGETVTSGEVKKDLTGVPLSTEASVWNVTGAIFPALVSNDQTLQQVGFAGQGWIDDLSITDEIPEFVKTVETFTITGGDHVESFRYNGNQWKKGNAPMIVTGVAPGTEGEVTDIVYEEGYFGPSTDKVLKNANKENVVGKAQKLVATVTIGDVATSYATINDAVAAINAATSDVTLKLGADVSGDVSELSFENTEGATITLDLAGKTVAASIYAVTKVVITDSVGTGKVDANVAGDDGVLEIQGGKYLASANGNLASSATLPEGKALVSDGNGYLVLGELGAEDGTETNPYTISTVEDLLQKVIVGADGAGKHYKLKNNIALTEKWAGFGIYADANNAFEGVFDGDYHTISGVTFADNTSGNNYRGFFNQINNATVKNLTVEGNGFGSDVPSGEYGCALLVGCANGSTIENCVAKGAIASATHNVGGIAVRIKDTTIRNCTNEANLTGSYTKVAGIVVLNQNSTEACLIEGCVNKGTLTAAGNAEKAGSDGLGGIVAYVGDDKLTITACTNEGVLVKGEGAHASAKVGQVIGWALKAAVVSGAIAVRNDICTVGDGVVDGLNFATVAEDGNVTLVADSAAVAGASLKVMANGAPVVGLKKGESITLDETLATADITVPEGCELTKEGNTYTVKEKSEEPVVKPVTPGASSEAYDSEDAAKAAAAAINANPSKYIPAPEGVTDKAAYAALFEATVNGLTVMVDLTAAATEQIQASVDAEIKKIDVAAVAAADGLAEQTITTVPGLYYSVIAGDTLTGMAVKWCELATGIEKKIPLPKVEGATSGFYKIQATVQKVEVAK